MTDDPGSDPTTEALRAAIGSGLVLVGGGQMGGALLSGLVGAGVPLELLAVVEPDPERGAALRRAHPGLRVDPEPVAEVVASSSGAVVAVKPEVAEPVCRILGLAGVTRVLSVAAGISTARLEDRLPGTTPVVRAMPNAPAILRQASSAMAGGAHVQARDLEWAEAVLGAVGRVVRVPERSLDAVTGLSGSGPAYVFLMAEALIEAGVTAGLTREQARTLTVGTLVGSAQLLEETGRTPEDLRASVTSPGGTTAAGLRSLEARAVRSAFIEAVASAAERSRQLGR